MILRKGAVSAKKGERLLIPINMRDGSLICVGKGNEDWNCSAPHGAGRLMSRSKAKQSFKDVYTTSVNKETLDECPCKTDITTTPLLLGGLIFRQNFTNKHLHSTRTCYNYSGSIRMF
jgi:RNA-splicing ligase RtcB